MNPQELSHCKYRVIANRILYAQLKNKHICDIIAIIKTYKIEEKRMIKILFVCRGNKTTILCGNPLFCVNSLQSLQNNV